MSFNSFNVLLMGAAAILFALVTARGWRGLVAATRLDGQCDSCGYDSRGNPSSTCPECGRAIDVTVSRISLPTAHVMSILVLIGVSGFAMVALSVWSVVDFVHYLEPTRLARSASIAIQAGMKVIAMANLGLVLLLAAIVLIRHRGRAGLQVW